MGSSRSEVGESRSIGEREKQGRRRMRSHKGRGGEGGAGWVTEHGWERKTREGKIRSHEDWGGAGRGSADKGRPSVNDK